MSEADAILFPPLMSGEQVAADALDHAVRRAVLGVDAGLVVYVLAADRIEAAMVLAPEVPLKKAAAMLPLCGVGFQNALGALAPPEVALHLEWDGGIRVNGASCGWLAMRAATQEPEAQPDWLVVGFTLPLLPPRENMGEIPDQTVLYAEGCADVAPDRLIEAWARHSLNWITRWDDEGPRALHAEWRGLAHGIGEDVTIAGQNGTFLGVDEDFGMLLRDEAGETHLIPLTDLLEDQT